MTLPSAHSLEMTILGIGAVGPGFNHWQELQALYASGSLPADIKTIVPTPEILPPAERRRASAIVKAGLAAGLEACADAQLDTANLVTIFSSSGGDGINCNAICVQLATDDRLISPTRFHNSVHNTVAGYWGIATGCMQPAQVISAEDGSFAAGLLEAGVQSLQLGLPCLMICYDTSYPNAMHAVRSISDTAAIALIINCAPQAPTKYPRLTLSVSPPPLDPIARATIPALEGLPLLKALAEGTRDSVQRIYLPLHGACALELDVTR